MQEINNITPLLLPTAEHDQVSEAPYSVEREQEFCQPLENFENVEISSDPVISIEIENQNRPLGAIQPLERPLLGDHDYTEVSTFVEVGQGSRQSEPSSEPIIRRQTNSSHCSSRSATEFVRPTRNRSRSDPVDSVSGVRPPKRPSQTPNKNNQRQKRQRMSEESYFDEDTPLDPLKSFTDAIISSSCDVDEVLNSHWKKFLLEAYPDINIPNEAELPSLREKNGTQYLNELLNEGLRNFCYFYLRETPTEISAFSFAVTKRYNTIFLCDGIIKISDNSIDPKKELYEFCDTVCKELLDQYGRTAKYIFYDGDIMLRSKRGTEGNRYFLINCFSTLFEKLLFGNYNWYTNNMLRQEENDIIDEYKAYVTGLKKQFTERQYRLGEGAELILQMFEEKSTVLNVNFRADILLTLNPAVLGANMMHPKYKGHRILKHEESLYTTMLNGFLYDALPSEEDIMDTFHSYRDNSPFFKEKSKETTDSIKYWSLVKQEFKKFAEFGMELYSLPSVMPKVDKNKLKKVSEKWCHDIFLKKYALSLVGNIKC